MALMWIAILLGLVEGITEFLPVSSTGHLIVAGHLLGFTGERASTFEIFIQLGAILAVVVLERRRFLGLLEFKGKSGFAGLRGCALLGLTTAPVLLAGFLLHHWIKERLFGPGPVAIALLVGGIIILLVDRGQRTSSTLSVDDMTWKQAAGIGLAQCLALWPGVSRSGATIIGGMLGGLDRRTAATYSFLAAVPAMTAATLYDLVSSRGVLQQGDAVFFAVGFAVSFVAALVAVRSFVALLGRHTLRPFGWYRVLVAPVIFWMVR